MWRPALLLVAIVCVIAAACDSDLVERAQAQLGGECLLDSECEGELVCVFERCHQQCETSADCQQAQRCVVGRAPTHVCLLADESECLFNSDCNQALLCAVDRQCRDECKTDQDCVGGQQCVKRVCADTSEVAAGVFDPADEGDPCLRDSDCPGSQRCAAGICRLECSVDEDCGQAAGCIEGVCLPEGTPPLCVPNAQQACKCVAGGSGVQICNAAGTGWGDCVACGGGVGGAGAIGGMGGTGGGGGGMGPLCANLSTNPSAVITTNTETVLGMDTLYDDHNGGVVMVAAVNNNNSVDFGLGVMTSLGASFFAVGFDSSLVAQWQKHIPNANGYLVGDAAVNASGVVAFVGSTSSSSITVDSVTIPAGSMFILALDGSTHAAAWGASWTSALALGARVAIDAAGNVYVAHNFFGTVDLGGGPFTSNGTDMYLAKFDSNGNYVWHNHYSAAGPLEVKALTADAAGNVSMAGPLKTNIDFGGGMLTGDSQGNTYVLRVDTNGNHLASAVWGGAGEQNAASITHTPNGDLALTGRFQTAIDFGGGVLTASGSDAYVAVLTPQLAHVSSHGFPNVLIDSLTVDAAGDMYVAGFAGISTTFDECTITAPANTPVIAKLDAQGNALWAKTFANVQMSAAANAIALIAPGGGSVLGVAGQYSNLPVQLDFGTQQPTGTLFLFAL